MLDIFVRHLFEDWAASKAMNVPRMKHLTLIHNDQVGEDVTGPIEMTGMKLRVTKNRKPGIK